MLRASAGLSASGSAEPVMRACQRRASVVLALDHPEDLVAQLGVDHERLGVATPDREVGLGQHHAHVVEHRPEERPAGVHRPQRRRRRSSPAANDSNAEPDAVPARQDEPALGPAEHPRDRPQVLDPVGLLARRRPAADVERGDLADRRDLPEELDEPWVASTRSRYERERQRRTATIIAAAKRAASSSSRSASRQRRLERRGHQRLQVAPGRRRLGVLGGDHLALLGDAERAVAPIRAAGPGSPRTPGPPPRPTVPPRPWNSRRRTPWRSAVATSAFWARYSAHCAAR